MDQLFQPLDPGKFHDPFVTAKGETRAQVPLHALATLLVQHGHALQPDLLQLLHQWFCRATTGWLI